MNGFSEMLKRSLLLPFVIALLSACGQGGTEVGNPNQPHDGATPVSETANPNDFAPSAMEPTPSPAALHIKDSQDSQAGDDQPEDDGALIANPEET